MNRILIPVLIIILSSCIPKSDINEPATIKSEYRKEVTVLVSHEYHQGHSKSEVLQEISFVDFPPDAFRLARIKGKYPTRISPARRDTASNFYFYFNADIELGEEFGVEVDFGEPEIYERYKLPDSLKVLNYTYQQEIDPSIDLKIDWQGFMPINLDYIQKYKIIIEKHENGVLIADTTLQVDSSEVVIPVNFLGKGATTTVKLEYINRQNYYRPGGSGFNSHQGYKYRAYVVTRNILYFRGK